MNKIITFGEIILRLAPPGFQRFTQVRSFEATCGILPIIDRVGGGDSFMGGLIYGLRKYAADLQKSLNFAATAAFFKHSIPGDFNAVTIAEVETLMAGDASGRVSR